MMSLQAVDVGQSCDPGAGVLLQHTNTKAHTHKHTYRRRHKFLLFLCNQLSEQDTWWDRLFADAKSLIMLCGEG